jgi:hypothetical protein
MTEHKVKTSILKTSEEVAIEAIQVGPNVEVRRVTTVRTSGDDTTTKVLESIVYTGETPNKDFGQFYVVPPSLPEKLRLTGWFADRDDYKLLSKTPFTHVLNGEPYVVIRLKSYDLTMFDVEGQPLPIAMPFCYYIDDNVFYLQDGPGLCAGLIDHLKTRADVTLIAPQHADEGDFIHKTPPDYHLKFIWHPDVETYRRFRAELGDEDWRRYELAYTYMGVNDAFRLQEGRQEEG